MKARRLIESNDIKSDMMPPEDDALLMAQDTVEGLRDYYPELQDSAVRATAIDFLCQQYSPDRPYQELRDALERWLHLRTESEMDDLKSEMLPQPWLDDYGRANKFKWDRDYNAWKKRIKLEQGYADMLLYPGGNTVKLLVKLGGQPTLMATTLTTDPNTGARSPRVLQRLEKSLAEYSAWDLNEYRLWLSQVGFNTGQ